jgi:hypothetical protein
MKSSALVRKTPMKRTGFTPKIKPLPGILRTTSLRPTRIKARRKSVPAHELAYLKRVAGLPCAECGIWGYSQAAHSNRAADGKGLGLKAHYLATFPLCCTRPGVIGCHVKHDNCIGMTREEADERTERYIAETQRLLNS